MPPTGAAEFAFDAAFRGAVASALAAFERQPAATPGTLKRAAVAIALAPDEGGTRGSFLLTRRAERLRAHAGQWALPGGRLDEGESAVDAALREMHEELGLRLAANQVLGLLDDYATRSGFLITPVVVWADAPGAVAINSDEVAELHRVPLELVSSAAAWDFVRIPESDRPVIRLHLHGHRIHAPTAAIVYQFTELLAGRCTRVAELDQPVFAWR